MKWVALATPRGRTGDGARGAAGCARAIRAARCSAGPRTLASVLERAHGEKDLFTRLARVLLGGTSEDGRRALGLALRVEYTHPAMTSAVTGESLLAQGPWIQPLEDGWSRVRNNWRDPLGAALGQRSMPSRETLHKAADWLLQAGEGDEAISVYFTLGDHDCAARAISGRAEGLIDLGRWQALEEWLDRLPPGLSAVYPNFDYVRAEMTAARGNWSQRAACTTQQRRGMPIAMTRAAPLAACLPQALPRRTLAIL